VLDHQGKQKLSAQGSGAIDHPQQLGEAVAAQLLDQGAAELIAGSRDAP
jgi:porphobilinogen deaminase